jgi:hypothetical protein
MKILVLAGAVLLSLSVAAAATPPTAPAGSTVPGRCTWIWKEVGDLGVWSERCDLDTGVWELEPSVDLPGFILTIGGDANDTVLQEFTKPVGAPIEAILPELRQRGYIPDDGECVFEAAAIRPAVRTISFFEIKPTGARKAAFDATPSDEVPDPPCGDYGWSAEGVRYFMTDLAHPDRVIYVNTGQDGMMFDETTITLK